MLAANNLFCVEIHTHLGTPYWIEYHKIFLRITFKMRCTFIEVHLTPIPPHLSTRFEAIISYLVICHICFPLQLLYVQVSSAVW